MQSPSLPGTNVASTSNGQPSLSVCVTNYNHAHYLRRAMSSACEQSFRPTEIIILDDVSTDNSWELINELAAADPLIKPLRNERNLGVFGTLNRLLREARGDYVHFLAADDYLLPGFYERSMRLLTKYPQAGLCCCPQIRLIEKEQRLFLEPYQMNAGWERTARFYRPQELIDLPGVGYLHGNTIVMKRSALAAVGGYRPEMLWVADWFSNCIVALRHGVCFQPEPLAVFRVSESQFSNNFSRWPEHGEIIQKMLRQLKEPELADVRPAFIESGIMSVMLDIDVVQAAFEAPDLNDEGTQALLRRLLQKRRASATAKARASQVRLAQYTPEYLRPKLHELVQHWKARDARVVIFGAGDHTANLLKWTDLNQAQIVGLVDSHHAGETFWSLPVRHPSEILRLRPDVVLLSSAASQEEMGKVILQHAGPEIAIARLYDETPAGA